MASPVASATPQVITPDMTDPNSTQLYINNLSFNTTREGLTSFFQSALGVDPSDVNIVAHKSGKSKGFGFVRVPKEKLQLALSLNGSTLDEREVGVVEARERTEEERQAQREKRDARRKEIADQRRAERTANARSSPTGAASATGASPATNSVGEPSRPPRARPVRKTYENATQLYFSNLAYDVSREQLKALVDEAIGGESLEVEIVTRRVGKFKGRSRGYGFVTVPNEHADKGLQLDGREVEGRVISVVVARERKFDEQDPTALNATADAPMGDGELKPAAAPRPRTRPPRRAHRPRQANGGGGDAPESKDAEAAAVAAAGSSTTVAAGSSAPTPAVSNGVERRSQIRRPRNKKPAAAIAAAQSAVPDVGGNLQ